MRVRLLQRWADAFLGVYAAGVVILLIRMVIGWHVASRIARAGRFLQRGVVESALVHTPVALGVLRPTILLPLEWRGWPDSTLLAALAHERAHIARRDPLVNALSRVNCCIFWFHPLAWWLHGTLAAEAEYAADDATIRDGTDAQAFARILLDMAAVVRERRSRLASFTLGLGGHHRLRNRIDRLLQGEIVRPISSVRSTILAGACFAAILVIAACRPATPQPPPEIARLEASMRDDPDALLRVARALIVQMPAGPRLDSPDLARLAEVYLQRSVQLDPNPDFIGPHMLRLEIQARLRLKRWSAISSTPLTTRYIAVVALPDQDRFNWLIDNARASGPIDVVKRWNDINLRQYEDLTKGLSRRFAEDLVNLAQKFQGHSRYGTAVFRAHMVLASREWDDQNQRAAIDHVRAAMRAPASEELVYGRGLAAWYVLSDLVAAGERQVVEQLLDWMAAMSRSESDSLRKLADALRAGEAPKFPGWWTASM